MSTFDWKSILRTVAPALATAAGGPLAGVAVKTIGDKLLGNPSATEEDVATALAGATPETLIRLREIDADFQRSMTEAGIKLEEIASGDRASARSREVQTRDWTPRILAFLVTSGFFGVLTFMLLHGKPESGGDALLVMLGALAGAWGAIINYYYGSSAGSARKTELIGQKP